MTGHPSMAAVAQRYGNRRHRPTPSGVAWSERGVIFTYPDGSSLQCYAPNASPADRIGWHWGFRAEHLPAEVTP